MEEFKSAMLIYNGNAGQRNVEKTLGECLPFLASKLARLLVLQTERENHAEELCREYGSEMDLVIILGGDGTVHECINGLAPLEKRPALMILPAGTCNDFARTLGIPLNIRRAAEVSLEGDIISVDAIKANNNYCLNFWGIGLITETSNNIKENEKMLLGKISYFLSAVRTVNQMAPFKVSLQIDGESIEEEAVMVLVANGHYIGTNLVPYKEIHYDDGKADVFVIKSASLALFRDLMTAREITDPEKEISPDILHYAGREIKVTTDSNMDADMDGEVYAGTPGEISVLKHHFRVMKPEK